jgi:acetoacetate decarboxylase
MKHETVRASAFAMPLTNPAFPAGPYRFVNREYFIIQYRTDLEALRRMVPEPLAITEPVVNYEFIRMPDSTGFGDYTESGQVIPVSYQGQAGSFVHQMFLNDHPPIAGGRELWGFPKKLAAAPSPFCVRPRQTRSRARPSLSMVAGRRSSGEDVGPRRWLRTNRPRSRAR